MKNGFTKLLLSDPRIVALVGNRIDWVTSPQGIPAPRLVLHRISRRYGTTMQGQDALKTDRIQIDIIAETDTQAEHISETLNKVLAGRSASVSGFEFSGIFSEGSRAGSEGTDAERVFVLRDDYFVNWKKRAEA